MRRIDAPTLRRVAEHHLSRHPSSKSNLVRVLTRRVANHVRKNAVPMPDGVPAMIASVVDALVADGFVDDQRLAEAKTRSMRARGKSAVAVKTKLRERGVEATVVAAVLDAETSAGGVERTRLEIELEAARTLVRKKKLGPFRKDPTRETHQKDLAAVARAGFSYDVAKRALSEGDAPD